MVMFGASGVNVEVLSRLEVVKKDKQSGDTDLLIYSTEQSWVKGFAQGPHTSSHQ